MKLKLETSKPCSYYFLTCNLAPTISFVRMCRIIFAESTVYLSFCAGSFYKQTFYSRFGRYYVIFLHYIKRVLNHLFLKHNENKKTSYCYVFFITNYQHYLSVWSKNRHNLLTCFEGADWFLCTASVFSQIIQKRYSCKIQFLWISLYSVFFWIFLPHEVWAIFNENKKYV